MCYIWKAKLNNNPLILHIMKKIIAMMCAALFLFGGTYALASTSVSEPQTMEKTKKKDKSGEKVKATDKKQDTKKDNKDKNSKEGNKKDNSKSDTSKK